MDRSYWPARIIDSIYIVMYKYRQLACRASKNYDANNDHLTSFSSLSSSSLSALFRRPWNQDLIDLFFTYTCLSFSSPTYHHRSYSLYLSIFARSIHFTSVLWNETKCSAYASEIALIRQLSKFKMTGLIYTNTCAYTN